MTDLENRTQFAITQGRRWLERHSLEQTRNDAWTPIVDLLNVFAHELITPPYPRGADLGFHAGDTGE